MLTLERCKILEEKVNVAKFFVSALSVSCVFSHRGSSHSTTIAMVLLQGFVVVDNACGLAWATALRGEMEWLMENGHMLPNKTQFNTAEGPKQFSKPHIFEVDLHDPVVPWPRLPEFKALREACPIAKAFQRRKPGFHIKQGIDGTALKLQCNTGGGCFPLHYDNPGVPNMRKLTALVYLNPDWQEGDGGELILQPFLGQRVRIPPLMDRMVVFLSDSILHSVAPSKVRRYCFTAWLDAEEGSINREEDLNLKVKHLEAIQKDALAGGALLASSPLQRVLSRALYHQEYEQSLRNCMQDAPGADLMLASHRDHMVQHRNNPALVSCVTALSEVAGTEPEILWETLEGNQEKPLGAGGGEGTRTRGEDSEDSDDSFCMADLDGKA